MPDAPKRVQRRRIKGWRMPPNAVYVGRPSAWGNPYDTVDLFRKDLEFALRRRPSLGDRLMAELRGRDLMCWCPLDQPCHADVLLDLANRPLKCEASDA